MAEKEIVKIKKSLMKNDEFLYNITHLIRFTIRKSKLKNYKNELYEQHTIKEDDEIINFKNKNNISNLSNVLNYVLEEEKDEFYEYLKDWKCPKKNKL